MAGSDASVRGMDSIIRLACIIHRTDYWRRGRTPDKLGIDQMIVTELTEYVNGGRWHEPGYGDSHGSDGR